MSNGHLGKIYCQIQFCHRVESIAGTTIKTDILPLAGQLGIVADRTIQADELALPSSFRNLCFAQTHRQCERVVL
jgi:hypothetical protein